MDAQMPEQIHFYDTRSHRILCGRPGFADRSSKHARNVTCEACVELLRARTAFSSTPEAVAQSPVA